jgi:mannose-6-phosphate isomerase-like protein (cupin superfamily)
MPAMADYTAKRIADMETGFGGGFVKVRAELGVTAFGMQIIQMPPDYGDYPEHDHSDSGQEEVYVTLSGSGWIDIEGERVELDPETLVRVAAASRRKVHAGPQGIRMLVLGGAPGKGYEITEGTELTGSAS